mmetsp:Transcript_3933/g.10163  ORF Transcript_3933/g.10163 Transcript_3933/m.10163 type:complete len:234 (-) Transcript_3933:31-732(-)
MRSAPSSMARTQMVLASSRTSTCPTTTTHGPRRGPRRRGPSTPRRRRARHTGGHLPGRPERTRSLLRTSTSTGVMHLARRRRRWSACASTVAHRRRRRAQPLRRGRSSKGSRACLRRTHSTTMTTCPCVACPARAPRSQARMPRGRRVPTRTADTSRRCPCTRSMRTWAATRSHRLSRATSPGGRQTLASCSDHLPFTSGIGGDLCGSLRLMRSSGAKPQLARPSARRLRNSR